ncbi:glycosyltransferase family 2 protein [Dolichospermum sp. LEGE 00246]|uniref:glycosyltransferase family 2 protein n=1 Tax=Dolichospermum sp. LEGE 00246 TaxID=1828605 RepID=UPI00187E83EA|nr:glycosyltransferase [Dolichospermum sp. LEGE 00246]MBE9257377.1 glycosyltransferase [Dolichospermum sp. LEGE 00246]
MKLSIIIPTINRYHDLKNTLIYLSDQNYKDFEVIIIDQTPILESQTVDHSRLLIRYYHSEFPSASAARNIGIKEAKGEILLFLDDDVIIENPDFIQNHIRHYADSKVPGVAGLILDKNQTKRYTRHWMSYRPDVGWLYFPRNYGCFCWVDGGGSGNLSVRRQVALNVGSMDENYVKGAHREESDFCLRVTQKYGQFIYDPDADLVHIGNIQGGCRTWTSNKQIMADHHFFGGTYFILKNIPINQYPDHLFCAFRYFVFNSNNLQNPWLIGISLRKLLQSFYQAWKILKVQKPSL